MKGPRLVEEPPAAGPFAGLSVAEAIAETARLVARVAIDLGDGAGHAYVEGVALRVGELMAKPTPVSPAA